MTKYLANSIHQLPDALIGAAKKRGPAGSLFVLVHPWRQTRTSSGEMTIAPGHFSNQLKPAASLRVFNALSYSQRTVSCIPLSSKVCHLTATLFRHCAGKNSLFFPFLSCSWLRMVR